MSKPLICLCLTAPTVKEDLALIEKYRSYIDLVELRVDMLEDDEDYIESQKRKQQEEEQLKKQRY